MGSPHYCGRSGWGYESTLGEANALTSTVTAISLTSDGSVLLSSCDNFIPVCRLETKEVAIKSHKEFVGTYNDWKDDDANLLSLCLSPDEKKLASGALEMMRLFDCNAHSDFFSFLKQQRCTVLQWRWTDGDWAGITWNGILARSVSFSADGELIAVTGSTTGVKLFKTVSTETDRGIHLNDFHRTYVVHVAFHQQTTGSFAALTLTAR